MLEMKKIKEVNYSILRNYDYVTLRITHNDGTDFVIPCVRQFDAPANYDDLYEVICQYFEYFFRDEKALINNPDPDAHIAYKMFISSSVINLFQWGESTQDDNIMMYESTSVRGTELFINLRCPVD